MTDLMWSAKFCAGIFSPVDASLSGRPVEVDSNQIKTLIESNVNTKWEIANIFKIPPSVLEITCTSLVMLVALILEFHICEGKKKTFLTIFLLVLIKMFQLDQLKAALDKKCLELGQQKMYNLPSG